MSDITEAALGSDHPTTALRLNNLAALRELLEDVQEGERQSPA
ncbi:hypothetical protein ACWD5R_00845 [Streptomyces sp. NPDC002514]